MGDLGRCSKHRKASEFSKGDRVRIVCVGGRAFSGLCKHLSEIGEVIGIYSRKTGFGIYEDTALKMVVSLMSVFAKRVWRALFCPACP